MLIKHTALWLYVLLSCRITCHLSLSLRLGSRIENLQMWLLSTVQQYLRDWSASSSSTYSMHSSIDLSNLSFRTSQTISLSELCCFDANRASRFLRWSRRSSQFILHRQSVIDRFYSSLLLSCCMSLDSTSCLRSRSNARHSSLFPVGRTTGLRSLRSFPRVSPIESRQCDEVSQSHDEKWKQ